MSSKKSKKSDKDDNNTGILPVVYFLLVFAIVVYFFSILFGSSQTYNLSTESATNDIFASNSISMNSSNKIPLNYPNFIVKKL